MRLASTRATLVRRCHHAESIEGGRHLPGNWGRFPQAARPSLSQPSPLSCKAWFRIKFNKFAHANCGKGGGGGKGIVGSTGF